MSLLDQIQDNAITNLRLKDTDDEMIDRVYKLVDAISRNTSIESIHFEGEYLGCLRGDARSELIEMIGKLPNLHEVHMGQSLLEISGATKMLMRAKKLRVLKLKSMVLQGVEEDFTACETALYAHMVLKEFEMVDCDAAVDTVSLDSLEMAGKKVSAMAKSATSSTIHVQKSAQVA
jgi:hypothetical protein